MSKRTKNKRGKRGKHNNPQYLREHPPKLPPPKKPDDPLKGFFT